MRLVRLTARNDIGWGAAASLEFESVACFGGMILEKHPYPAASPEMTARFPRLSIPPNIGFHGSVRTFKMDNHWLAGAVLLLSGTKAIGW